MMKNNKVELLAPAGSHAALVAAINAGADSVYLGIGDMNMRASSAVNFELKALPEVVHYAHKHNVRIFVTLNTLVYDNEISEIKDLLKKIKESKADAVIVSDLAVIELARELNLEVHISTQLSISNIGGVKFFARYSDRMVLARELNLEQIKYICDEIKKQDIRGPKGNLIEIEVFAHGALCVAVSGRCSMSLYCYNKSANRGKCSQLCRRQYNVTDTSTGKEMKLDNNFIMSSSDLCTIGMLPELLETGVKALKFEGRGRSPEYVDLVVTTYKEAIETVEKGTYSKEKVKKWNERLGTVFNKGFTTNFFMGRTIAEWAGVHGSKSSETKTHLGIVEKYYPKIKVVQILIQAKDEIKTKQKFLIIGEKTGVVKGILEEIYRDENSVNSANQGDQITFKLNTKVRPGDIFYKVIPNISTVSKGKENFVRSNTPI